MEYAAKVEAIEKAKKVIKESITRELLETARNYVKNFSEIYGENDADVRNLLGMIREQDIRIHHPNFTWEQLNLEAYNGERDTWCRVVTIDTYTDSISVSNGSVSFCQKLSETPMRSRQS